MENLIKFVSNEQMDNLISPCAFRPLKVNYIYDPEKANKYCIQDIEHTLNMFDHSIKADFIPIRDLFSNNSQDELQSVIANLTKTYNDIYADFTGTSVGAVLNAFGYITAKGIKSFSVDIMKDEVIQLAGFSSGEKLSYVTPHFNVKQIISAHGASAMRSGRPTPLFKYFPILKKLSVIILGDLDVWKKQGKFLQKAQAHYSEGLHVECDTSLNIGSERVYLDDHFLYSLYEAGALDYANIKNKRASFKFHDNFIKDCLCDIGIWAEVITYITALQSGFFDDVQMSVKIDWDGEREDIKFGSAFNEIDNICVKGYIPLFISCKTSEPSIEAINELYLYANHFGGAGAKCAIVTLGDMKSKQVYFSGIDKRAHDLGISLIDYADIRDGFLAKKLQEAIGNRLL
ncbi:MAG: hypothetical protein VB118_11300 [Oscillospiraceae bacterium]|nr:hypothetical protein [Oscillospiraceae bacterium]